MFKALFFCGIFLLAFASECFASVEILAPFPMPGLNRDRVVRIYLPPSYSTSEKRYPVLYMHDGQNLFDAATAFAGEWNVDESLDALAKSDHLEVIVVGIDNGQEKRMNELSPWPHRRYGTAEGKQYLGFLVDTVKPYVDQRYRTLSDRDNTAIMGSSMGGLMSHYAIHQYPALFSKAGIFSPSYWYSKDVYKHTRDNAVPATARLYVMVGSKEGKEAADKMQKMATQLRKQQHPEANLHIEVVQGGEHNEAFWRKEFPKAMRWLFKTH